MNKTRAFLAHPIVLLCGFVLLPVGNKDISSIYLWYIVTGLDDKGVDAIFGLTAIVFMAIEWIGYELTGELMMFRILNFICGGLMLASLVLFNAYDDKHLPYEFIAPWSYLWAAVLTIIIIHFLYIQVTRFHRH